MDRQTQIPNLIKICSAASTAGHGKYNKPIFCNYFDQSPKISVKNIYQNHGKKIIWNREYRRVEKLSVGKINGNSHAITCHEGTEEEQKYSSALSLTLALDGVGCLTPRSYRFNPGNDTVPTVQEGGWALLVDT
jgi:hypothetical protein